MNYYRLHIGDYLRDASHLSLLEHGVYTRLLQVYYTREQGVGDAEKYRLIGARSPEEREAVDAVLAEFFVLSADGVWRQSRCERELEAYRQKAERNREVGRLGGRPPRSRNPQETQTVSGDNPNETLASSQEPIAKRERRTRAPAAALAAPDGVPAELWSDWLRVRKAKRSGEVTETALAGMRREAGRAGISLADAIRVCVERSWTGFNAAWDWQPTARSAGLQGGRTAAAEDRRAFVASITGHLAARSTNDPRTIDVDQPDPGAPRLALAGR